MTSTSSILSKLAKGGLAVALAATMSLAFVGLALADDDDTSSSYWTSPTSAIDIDSNMLKTYGVRAGSAGGDYLGISNTNFDWNGGSASQTDQYVGYYDTDFDTVTVAGLAIWATSVNENVNPYYANMWYNVVSGVVGTDEAATQATTWMSNNNAWGDSNGSESYFYGTDTVTIAGLEYEPEIIFGANKTTNWANFSVEGTTIYTWVESEENTVGYSPTYVNNDATNVWTQIYTMGQLATVADEITSSSDLYTRYDDSDATVSAVSYEKAIRGQMLYIASLIDSGKLEQKTVAYLYAIDADGTGYFFVPTAEGLVTGETTVYSSDNTVSNNDDNYAANNSTINMGYMATLPFISTTFDSGNELEGGIVMAVENLYKENPACIVDASSADDVMADVDVIIYNTTTYTSDMSGTTNGRNSSGVTNDYNGDALSAEEVAEWAAQYGFDADEGLIIAGDDYGTSTKQGYGTVSTTEDGMSPLLYCQRNYTADKNTRAAWAFSMVYPEAYEGNNDATYGYWVDTVYHVNTDSVASVVQYMTNQSSEVTYTEDTYEYVEQAALAGYIWWITTGSTDEDWSDYAYYNGSSRASYFSDTSSDEETDTIGIFAPSSLWTESISTIDRIGGTNRYETAYLEAMEAFSSAETVILATGTDYADALAASALAGALDAPVLLVKGTDSTVADSYAAQAIEELGATNVIIVGGTGAVSQGIEDELAETLTVTRVSGTNRYETAVAIYNYGAELDVWGDQIIIASGANYADALSVSSLAYAEAYPILLADSTLTLRESADAIVTASDASVIIVGGTGVVSADTETAYSATRLAGSNRYETSIAIAEYAVDNGYLTWDGVALTTGDNYPDALAAASLQGQKGSVLLLVNDKWAETIIDSIDTDSVTSAIVIGGEGAVSATIYDALATAIDAAIDLSE